MIEIILAVLLVLAAIERFALIVRHDHQRACEQVLERQERADLIARVQGLSWRPERQEGPTQELVVEPDELGMIGTIQYGDDNE